MMNFSILNPPGIAFTDCKEHCSVNHIQPIPSRAFLQDTKCPDERILGQTAHFSFHRVATTCWTQKLSGPWVALILQGTTNEDGWCLKARKTPFLSGKAEFFASQHSVNLI